MFYASFSKILFYSAMMSSKASLTLQPSITSQSLRSYILLETQSLPSQSSLISSKSTMALIPVYCSSPSSLKPLKFIQSVILCVRIANVFVPMRSVPDSVTASMHLSCQFSLTNSPNLTSSLQCQQMTFPSQAQESSRPLSRRFKSCIAIRVKENQRLIGR